jgi:hypothetical protein
VNPQTAVRRGSPELSLGQEALWFLHQLAPDSSAYNVSAALNLHDPVDVAVLAAAVERVVTRHRQLNLVFRAVGGRPERYPCGDRGPVLDVHDLGAADDDAVRAFAADLARRPFRLDRERPIRIALLCREDQPDVLLAAAHHIVLDNVSQLLVFAEVFAECAQLPGPGTDTGFDDFVRRERAFLDSRKAQAARDFWRRALADLPAGDLPADLPRPDVYTFSGAEIDFELPPDLMAGVEAAAADRATTVFVFLFSAFQLLLHRFGGQRDFVVGSPVTLRSGRRYRDSIGYFVNLLPFRVRVPQDGAFGTLLRATGDTLWRVLAHRDFPYALIPPLVDTPRDPSRAGLISTMFVATGGDDPLDALALPGRRAECAGYTVSEFYLPQQQGQLDLTLQVLRHGGAARAHLKYNTSLFTAETVRDMAARYLELLSAAVRGEL